LHCCCYYYYHHHHHHHHHWGHAVAELVEALCYKSEGRGFDCRWGHWIFQFT
jgi:hypothetical protein